MAKSKNKRREEYEDAEHYGRLPKLKDQPQKRQQKNWKKIVESHDPDEDFDPYYGDVQ